MEWKWACRDYNDDTDHWCVVRYNPKTFRIGDQDITYEYEVLENDGTVNNWVAGRIYNIRDLPE